MEDFEFKEPVTTKTFKGKAAAKPEPVKEASFDEEMVDQLVVEDAPEYDEAELDAIFDALMFEGRHVEDVSVGKGRLPVTFTTRTGKDTRFAMSTLDKQSLRMGITVESFRAMYNLAQALMVFNGRDLSGETFERRLEFVEDLPTPIIGALMTKLVKFDLKVEAAIRHGEENF